MLVGAGDGDGVSHDQLAAIGREYSTLVKKEPRTKMVRDLQDSSQTLMQKLPSIAQGAVVIETIVLEDKYRVIVTGSPQFYRDSEGVAAPTHEQIARRAYELLYRAGTGARP